MASFTQLFSFLFPLLATSLHRISAFEVSIKTSVIAPLNCSANIKTCNAFLYHISHNHTVEEIATFYSVSSSQINPIMYRTRQDYLITVPCSCKKTDELSGYFYDTTYTVRPNDIFSNISDLIYSGQAWPVTGTLFPEDHLSIHIPCGCSENESQIVVTYTVQQNDTQTTIANLLNSTRAGILSMNIILDKNTGFIDLGWVLFVPKELKGLRVPPSNKKGDSSPCFSLYFLQQFACKYRVRNYHLAISYCVLEIREYFVMIHNLNAISLHCFNKL